MKIKPHFRWLALTGPLAVTGALFAPIAGAQTANVKSTFKPASLQGLHIVFDASESMCGYFAETDAKKRFLGAVKESVKLKDPGIGNRVYLLKQLSKSTTDVRRDIIEAPANLQSASEVLAVTANKKGPACQPFNGVGSNLELIFDRAAPMRDAETIILVTDGQLAEKDRDKFVQGFHSWATEAQAAGSTPYFGLALSETEFTGRYYPVGDPSIKKREAGYQLSTHNRPLMVFWFAKSDKHLQQVQGFLNAVAPEELEKSKDAFVQHVLPIVATGRQLFTQKPSFAPPLSALIGSKPTFEFSRYANDRTDSILAACLRSQVTDSQIQVQADNKCRDGKAIFEGVSAIVVSYPIAKSSHLVTKPKTSDAKEGVLSFRLTPKSINGEQSFQLASTFIEGSSSRIDLKPYSIDSDYCVEAPGKSAKGADGPDEECTLKLAAKAYQLDVLVDQLVARQKRLVADALTPLNSKTYTLSFKSR